MGFAAFAQSPLHCGHNSSTLDRTGMSAETCHQCLCTCKAVGRLFSGCFVGFFFGLVGWLKVFLGFLVFFLWFGLAQGFIEKINVEASKFWKR